MRPLKTKHVFLILAALALVLPACQGRAGPASPTVAPTNTLFLEETTTPEASATPELAPPELAILSFAADVEDIPNGKRVTFHWQTTGATSVTIWSGTRDRLPIIWAGPPNGTMTQDITFTYYPNPTMQLGASDGLGNAVSQSLAIDWPCEYEYFFAAPVNTCPVSAAGETWAVEQPFERGRMIWLQDVGEPSFANHILVLYTEGTEYIMVENTWSEGEPESDPAFAPPEGLHQPVRQLGKLWRENADLRERLGWALALEQEFTTYWQRPSWEPGPIAYLRLFDGQIIQIDNPGAPVPGRWWFVTPSLGNHD